jgi:NitT/TauT family transport system ATP-binding protein
MRQRVALARTLLADRPVLLLDEPFASLDSITRAELQEWLLAALAGEPRTVVLVTHDIEEALYLCDRVLVMSRRPGTVTAELQPALDRSAPRAEVVTSTEFSRLRHDALEALS